MFTAFWSHSLPTALLWVLSDITPSSPSQLHVLLVFIFYYTMSPVNAFLYWVWTIFRGTPWRELTLSSLIGIHQLPLAPQLKGTWWGNPPLSHACIDCLDLLKVLCWQLQPLWAHATDFHVQNALLWSCHPQPLDLKIFLPLLLWCSLSLGSKRYDADFLCILTGSVSLLIITNTSKQSFFVKTRKKL